MRIFLMNYTIKTVLNIMLVSAFIWLISCRIPFTLHEEFARYGTDQLPSESCRECHSVIYDEWKESAHSHAYSDDFFRSITNDYMVDACITCHSPESAFSDKIEKRKMHIKEGVNCYTCHLHKGVLQGPIEKHLPFDIHPIMEKNPIYRSSELCGKCHKKTFEEYKKSGEKEKTCQDCHMPEIKRTIIDNRPWVWTKGIYSFRRHVFSIHDKEELQKEINLDMSIRDDSPVSGEIIVENKSIPHNIPTGGYGYHEIILSITLLDNLAESVQKITYSMTQELETSLKKDDKKIVSFTFSDKHEFPWAVKATLIKTDFDRQKVKVLKEIMVVLY